MMTLTTGKRNESDFEIFHNLM